MAQTIKLKRSSVAGRVPTTSDLELGEIAINTADGKLYIKKDVGGTESIIEIGTGNAVTSSFTLHEFTATASQTTFTGTDSNGNVLAYDTGTPPKVQVFLNGVLLDFTTDYTASNGTSVVLAVGASLNDTVQIAAYKSVSVDSDLSLSDNTKILLGNSDDLEIYHDGSNSILNDAGTGNLQLQTGGATKAEITSTGITITGEVNTDSVQFDTAETGATTPGQIAWNTDTGTLELGLNADVNLELGEQNYFQVKAAEAISKGDVVYASGAVGNSSKIEVSKYIANNTIEEQRIVGLAAEDMALNDFGFVISLGTLRGLQTDGQNLTTTETWVLGDILYASAAVAGELTRTRPSAPNQAVPIAFITAVNSSSGALAVRAYELGSHLTEIHDVEITSVADNDLLQWNASASRWENVAGTTSNIAEGTNLYWTTARGDSNFTTNLAASDTDDLSEGATNLYYTSARANTDFDTRLATKSTTDLVEGTNLYYTSTRFDTAFSAKSTTDLSEGTNLYYTDARFDTRLGTKSTTDLAEGTNLYYTSTRFDTAFSAKTTDNLSEGSTNLYYTSARANTDFDTRLATKTTDNLSEGSTNLYYTDARARSAISATTGSAAYNSTTGVFTLPGTTDHITEGTNLFYTDARVDSRLSSGSVSNIQITGYLRGPSSFTIDPAAHGDNTGTVIIAGNLQVDGTTTTINSTTLTVDDKNIVLADGAANAAAADGAGITIDGASASLTYSSSSDRFEFNKPAYAGSLYAGNVQTTGSIGNLTAGSLGQQLEKGDASVTTLRFDADRWRLYAGNSAGEIIAAYENGNIDFTTGNLLKGGTAWMDNSRNLTNIGTVSSTHFTSSANINSTGVGGITVGGGRVGFDQSGVRSWTQYAAGGNLLFASGDGNGAIQANNFTASTYQINSTTVIDSSRNLTNIGTISSGAITSSSTVTAKAGAGGIAGVLQSTASWSSGVLYAPGLIWQEADGTNIAGIRGFVDGNGNNNLAIGTGWLDQELIVTSSGISVAGTIGSGAITSTGLLNLTRSATAADVNYLQIYMPSWSQHQGYLKSLTWNDGSNIIAGIGAEYDGTTTNIHFHSQYNSAYKGSSVKTFSVYGNGDVNLHTGALQIGGTTVIDSSRNLTNIGTIASGAITSSGDIQTTAGKLIIKSSSNGFGRIEATDANHIIVIRGDRDSTTTGSDKTTYYQYGGTRANGLGHLFYTGGVLASQTLKLGIHNDAIAMYQPLYMGGVQVLDASRNLTNIGAITSSGNIYTTAGKLRATGSGSDYALELSSTYAYASIIAHNIANASQTFNDAIFLQNTNSSDSNYVSIGMSTNGTDGQHHRAQLRAVKDTGGNYLGKFQIYTRGSGGSNNLGFEVDSSSNVRIPNGTLTSSGTIYTNQSLVVNDNVSGNHYLYLKRPVGSDGHLLFQEGQSLRWQNIAGTDLNWYSYTASATTFQLQGSGGANLLVGDYKINGTTVIDSSRNLANVTYKNLNVIGSRYHDIYKWPAISASAGQARRAKIMRVYYTPNHWGSWINLRVTLSAQGYVTGRKTYQINAAYNMGNGNSLSCSLVDSSSNNTMGVNEPNNRMRLTVGAPTDSGWDYSGQNTYYQDIYVDVDYYHTVAVIVENEAFGGVTFSTSNPASGTGFAVVITETISYSNITYTADPYTNLIPWGVRLGRKWGNPVYYASNGKEWATVPLASSSSSQSNGPTAGSVTNEAAIFTNSDIDYGLSIGVAPSGDPWLQSMRFDGGGTQYKLNLQPLGGETNLGGALKIANNTVIDSNRRNIYLDSFAGGDNNGIFFRSGFTGSSNGYNCSITVQDHNGGASDGLHISAYDGVGIGTGANTYGVDLLVDVAGNTTIYGSLNTVGGYQLNGTTVLDSARNLANIGSLVLNGQITFGNNTTAGRYDIVVGSQTTSRGMVFAPYVTFGTRYSGWDAWIGSNTRTAVGTTDSGIELATSYTAGGASALNQAFAGLNWYSWTASELSGLGQGSALTLGTPKFSVSQAGNGSFAGTLIASGTIYGRRNSQNFVAETSSDPSNYYAVFEANYDYGEAFRIRARGAGSEHAIMKWADAAGLEFNGGANSIIKFSGDNLSNIGTISSGVITAEGASGGKNLVYASNFAASGAGIQLTLERTGNATGWGGIGADVDYCFSAWGGSGGVTRRFGIGQSGNADLLYGDYKVNGTTVIDSARNITAVNGGFSGFLSNAGGAQLEIQGSVDGGSSRGIYMWETADTNWGIYMATSGSGKSLSGGTAPTSLDGRTSHHIRFRTYGGDAQRGWIFENSSDLARVSITSDSGNIFATGNVTAYASDARLKENVTTITGALAKVKQLRGVEFDWKDECESLGFVPSMKHETGVIAQEVQAVIPDAVVPAPFDNDYLTVHKDKIVPLLIEAIKEQQQQIEALQALIKEIKNGNH